MVDGRTHFPCLFPLTLILLLAAALPASATACQAEPAAAGELSLTALMTRGRQSAVQVLAYIRLMETPLSTRSREGIVRSQAIVRIGSGVRFGASNRVITALGVVSGADSIEVQVGTRKMPATLLGTDAPTHLALLSVNALLSSNTPPQIAGTGVEAGEAVVLVDILREGTVLYHGRVRETNPRGLIYTTLPVLAGLNGAPLLNGAGEVVGIVTLQYRPEGWSAVTGDAVGISAGLAAYVAGEIETFGQVRWGWFGATADSTITDRIVLIGVDPGGPAALAGLRSGDAVTHYGGQSLAGVDHLRSLVLATAPGTTVPVGIVRDSLRSDAYVVIGDWSEAFAPASDLSLIEQRAVDQEVLIRMHALIEELNLLMLHPAFDPRRGEVLNRIMRIEREIGEMRRIALPDRPPPP